MIRPEGFENFHEAAETNKTGLSDTFNLPQTIFRVDLSFIADDPIIFFLSFKVKRIEILEDLFQKINNTM